LALYDSGYATTTSSTISPASCFIQYQLIVIDGANYNHPITLNAGERKIEADPMVYNDHIGNHNYFVKACVYVENTFKNCMQSN